MALKPLRVDSRHSIAAQRDQRLMHTVIGIQAMHPRSRTRVSNAEYSVCSYLLHNVAITPPNQV